MGRRYPSFGYIGWRSFSICEILVDFGDTEQAMYLFLMVWANEMKVCTDVGFASGWPETLFWQIYWSQFSDKANPLTA